MIFSLGIPALAAGIHGWAGFRNGDGATRID